MDKYSLSRESDAAVQKVQYSAVQCSAGTRAEPLLRDSDSGSWQLNSSDSDRPSELVDTT